MDRPPLLSVVVPMYDESAVVDLFADRLRPVLDGLGVTYEVVCVDDGSRDDTASLIGGYLRSWPQLRLVRLLRNSGHQAAITAGLASSLGDYTVTIDADLQDPPEVIGTMLRTALDRRVDVVYAIREDRSADTAAKRVTAGVYYSLMRRLAGQHVPHNAGDFRLMSRRVVEALQRLPEHGRVYRLVVPWFGFPSAEVGFQREKRAAGTSKYPLSKMVALAVDSVTSFSAAPLRAATWLGLGASALCGLLAVLAVLAALFGHTVPGWASVLLVLGLLGAVQLLCLGILGEYVGRLFTASQQRPMYLIGYDSLSDPYVPSEQAPEHVGTVAVDAEHHSARVSLHE